MEVRKDPYNIKIKYENSIALCSCCNSKLNEIIKEGSYMIGEECSNCAYSMRPFVTEIKKCFCEYGKKDFIYMVCDKCSDPKCIQCNSKIRCHNNNCNNIICIDCKQKNEFKNKWNNSFKSKLECYGIIKLRLLAKSKKVKGYSKYKKDELINILEQLVSNIDFPIKL